MRQISPRTNWPVRETSRDNRGLQETDWPDWPSIFMGTLGEIKPFMLHGVSSVSSRYNSYRKRAGGESTECYVLSTEMHRMACPRETRAQVLGATAPGARRSRLRP